MSSWLGGFRDWIIENIHVPRSFSAGTSAVAVFSVNGSGESAKWRINPGTRELCHRISSQLTIMEVRELSKNIESIYLAAIAELFILSFILHDLRLGSWRHWTLTDCINPQHKRIIEPTTLNRPDSFVFGFLLVAKIYSTLQDGSSSRKKITIGIWRRPQQR